MEEKIDQFRFEGEEGASERLVQLLDSKIEFDRISASLQPKLVVAHVDTSSKEEERDRFEEKTKLERFNSQQEQGGNFERHPQDPNSCQSSPSSSSSQTVRYTGFKEEKDSARTGIR